MKICIPTETNEGKSAQVFGHFGSAAFFTIYDTEKKTIEILDNKNQHHEHGMCQPLSAFVNIKIDAVVCGGMGGRAVMKLNESGIKAYRALEGTVEETISQFEKGKLEEITVNNACGHHGCH